VKAPVLPGYGHATVTGRDQDFSGHAARQAKRMQRATPELIIRRISCKFHPASIRRRTGSRQARSPLGGKAMPERLQAA